MPLHDAFIDELLNGFSCLGFVIVVRDTGCVNTSVAEAESFKH